MRRMFAVAASLVTAVTTVVVAKRVAQAMVVALSAAIGVFVFAGPASAAVGGCTSTTLASPCVNFGDSPNNRVRADFYLNQAPDQEHYYYRVAIHKLTQSGGDNGQWVSPLTRLTTTGHYCCWYREDFTSLPPGTKGAKTVLYIYTSAKIQHNVLTSPTIWFVA